MMDYLEIIASCDLEFGLLGKLNDEMKENVKSMSRFAQPFYLVFVCLYKAKISGEHLQDHWSSGSETIAACDLKLIDLMKICEF